MTKNGLSEFWKSAPQLYVFKKFKHLPSCSSS